MSHFLLLLYVAAFSLGFGVVTLVFTYARRYGNRSLWFFGYMLLSSSGFLLLEALKIYEQALQVALGPVHTPLLAALCGVSSGTLAVILPWFCFDLVGVPISRTRRAVHHALAVAALLLGVLQETVSHAIFWRLDFALLMGLHGYGVLILWPNLQRIAKPYVRSMVRSFILLVLAFSPFALAQLILHDLPGLPPFLRYYPLEPLLYYLAVMALLYSYAAIFLFAPTGSIAIELNEEAIYRIGISSREKDIILLLMQGFSQKRIGDRLGISPRTVKNHVYNVFQKAGVENRVQLLNILSSKR
jgi:DNA-binding CsgD family transcriptional regulator